MLDAKLPMVQKKKEKQPVQSILGYRFSSLGLKKAINFCFFILK